MAVVTVTGSQVTFKFGATAYTAQVTGGTITTSPNINRTKTLSDVAYALVDKSMTASVALLFDDEAAAYGALSTAALAGTATTAEFQLADAKFTYSVYVTDLSIDFSADGLATVSASFIGETAAPTDVTP